jgi:murein L,D-transpeptidase YcbB/YkuD
MSQDIFEVKGETMSKDLSKRSLRVSAWSVLWCGLFVAFVHISAVAAPGESGPIHNDGLIWPVLRKGAHRPPVRALQYLLRSRKYALAVDGNFGNQTENAVKRYQRAHHLKADGIVGAYTWESLVSTLRRGSRGDAVRAAQTLLNWHLSYGDAASKKPKRIQVDGIYGKTTERAVRTFQQSIGIISMNGKVDKATWCYLSGGRLDGE